MARTKPEWHLYAEKLIDSGRMTHKEVQASVCAIFPELNPSTVYQYITRFNTSITDKKTKDFGYSCPVCGDRNTRIVHATEARDNVRRKRECKSCGYSWTTIEIDEDMYNSITKRFYNGKDW